MKYPQVLVAAMFFSQPTFAEVTHWGVDELFGQAHSSTFPQDFHVRSPQFRFAQSRTAPAAPARNSMPQSLPSNPLSIPHAPLFSPSFSTAGTTPMTVPSQLGSNPNYAPSTRLAPTIPQGISTSGYGPLQQPQINYSIGGHAVVPQTP